MAYVDLNPIRANMAKTPEASDHTSIKKRIHAAKNNETPQSLAQFIGNPRAPMPQGLPFKLSDYIELVDWTGRILRSDKKGAIASNLPPIIERLGVEVSNWMQLTSAFEKNTKTFVGSETSIEHSALQLGYKRMPNRQRCKALFGWLFILLRF